MYVLSVCELGWRFYFSLKYCIPMGIQDKWRDRVSLKGRNSGGPEDLWKMPRLTSSARPSRRSGILETGTISD